MERTETHAAQPIQVSLPTARGVGEPTQRSRQFGSSTRRLLYRLRPDSRGVVLSIGIGAIGVLGQIVGPKILGHATDIVFSGLTSPQGIDFPALQRVLLLLAALYVTAASLAWLQSVVLTGAVQRAMRRLRSDVEDKLNRLPLRHVDTQPRGDLLSRITNDIDNLSQSLQQTLSQIVTSVLSLAGVLGMMIWISPTLALIAVVSIPLSTWIIRTIAGRSKDKFRDQWRHTGVLNARVEETFTGHAVVKAFGRRREVEQQFGQTNRELYESSFRAQFVSGVIQPAMMLLGNLNFVAIAVLGGLRVSSGTMSLGDVQAFLQYSRQFSMPLTHIASMINVFQSGVASAERIFELLDSPDESPDEAAGPATVPVRGRVEFNHVSFAYDPARPLISDLSLVAEPGQTVAIVGPTGGGKTTLVNLIMRFYELDGGTISIDGRDIATMPRREVRSSIGMVLQDTWLFGGTIRENIAYGNPDATDEEVRAAASATYVDRFVHSLPDGYDTVVDDDGAAVSAGEKQLITIARAFLADPAILILDEATSSVDTRTEVLIQHAMAALRSQRTSFVIAHRLSTIRDADVILVMDAGHIVDQGTHEELIIRGGAYAALYQAQFSAPVQGEAA